MKTYFIALCFVAAAVVLPSCRKKPIDTPAPTNLPSLPYSDLIAGNHKFHTWISGYNPVSRKHVNYIDSLILPVTILSNDSVGFDGYNLGYTGVDNSGRMRFETAGYGGSVVLWFDLTDTSIYVGESIFVKAADSVWLYTYASYK